MAESIREEPKEGNDDIERLCLESRFDDVIKGLWCEKEQKQFLRSKKSILKDISTDELRERLDKFDQVNSNFELVEKYMTIVISNIMDSAPERGKTNLENHLTSALGEIFLIFANMTKTLDEKGSLDFIIDENVDFEEIIFECSRGQNPEFESSSIFSYQLRSPHFNFIRNRKLENNVTKSSKPQQIFPNPVQLIEKNNQIDPSPEELLNIKTTEKLNSYKNDNPLNVDILPSKFHLMKEYNHHLNYIGTHMMQYEALSTKNVLTSLSPETDFNVIKNEYITFTRTKNCFTLTNNISNTFKVDCKKQEYVKHCKDFTSSFTKPKIDFAHEYATYELNRGLNSDDEHEKWRGTVISFTSSLKFSVFQTIQREFLAALGFPTLEPLENNLSNVMIHVLTEYFDFYIFDMIDQMYEEIRQKIRKIMLDVDGRNLPL